MSSDLTDRGLFALLDHCGHDGTESGRSSDEPCNARAPGGEQSEKWGNCTKPRGLRAAHEGLGEATLRRCLTGGIKPIANLHHLRFKLFRDKLHLGDELPEVRGLIDALRGMEGMASVAPWMPRAAGVRGYAGVRHGWRAGRIRRCGRVAEIAGKRGARRAGG